MRPLRSLLVALLAMLLLAPLATVADGKSKKAKEEAAARALAKKLPAVRGTLKAKIGIADQKADFFTDPRFTKLNLKIARRSVAWDAMDYDWQIADIDQWLRGAQAAGVRPLVTFARSRIDSKRHVKPTVEQIRQAFAAFRARWPQVTEFVASNESNHGGEPTGKDPALAARYYKAMRSVCPSCKIAAATLLDQPNLVKWAKQFVKAAGQQPKYWALHNYVSANRFDVTRTRELLLAIKGEIWLTEVGGLVKRRTPDRPGKVKLKEGISHAAQVTRYIFDQLVRISPRISRVYLYHWNAEGPAATWDSGLVGADGKPRPAYKVFETVLKEIRSGKVPKGLPGADAVEKVKGKVKKAKDVVVGGKVPAR